MDVDAQAGGGSKDSEPVKTESNVPAARPPIKDKSHEQQAAEQQIHQDVGGNESSSKDVAQAEDGSGAEVKKGAYPGPRSKATFVTLARNEELYELVKAIRNVEDRFNRKFNYDWVFLNDVPFTDEFKKITASLVSGEAKFGLIPKEHWGYPDWVDQAKAAENRKAMEGKVIYGGSESYRHMCRFESGFFFRHPLMEDYDWYWRVEPGIALRCDVEYDLFRYMEENDKVYSFTITIHEFRNTIPTLWDHTKKFMQLHPEHIAENNFMKWISDDDGATYNLCHFWSNFEVASLKFLRSKAYMDYFEYLDKTGGFFYERWGDAPVHSIAVSLMLPKDKIHFFSDLGYTHGVYTQCPLNEQFRLEHKCDCRAQDDFTFRGYSCGKQYYDAMGLERPAEWKNFQ